MNRRDKFREDPSKLSRARRRELLYGFDPHGIGYPRTGEGALAQARLDWQAHQSEILEAWKNEPGPRPPLPWCARLWGVRSEHQTPFKRPADTPQHPEKGNRRTKKGKDDGQRNEEHD